MRLLVQNLTVTSTNSDKTMTSENNKMTNLNLE